MVQNKLETNLEVKKVKRKKGANPIAKYFVTPPEDRRRGPPTVLPKKL